MELKSIAEILDTTADDLLNPNPYIIQISHSPQSLGNGTYNNYLSEDVVKMLKSKDEQSNKLMESNINLSNTICVLAADFNKIVNVFEQKLKFQ